MSMKKGLGVFGAYAIASSILANENSLPITVDPESEKDKRRRQYQ